MSLIRLLNTIRDSNLILKVTTRITTNVYKAEDSVYILWIGKQQIQPTKNCEIFFCD